MAKFWTAVVTPGTYGSSKGGKTVDLTEEMLRKTAANGNRLSELKIKMPVPKRHRDEKDRLVSPVASQLKQDWLRKKGTTVTIDPATGKKPEWDPALNQGFVSRWSYLGKDDDLSQFPGLTEEHRNWLLAEVEIDDDNKETIQAFKKGTIPGTSIGLADGYRIPNNPSKSLDGPVPLHLATPLNPMTPGQPNPVPSDDPSPAADPRPALVMADEPFDELILMSSHEDPAPSDDSDDPADEKDPQAAPMATVGHNLGDLIKAVEGAGIPNLALPPDTTEENVVDRLITLLHSLGASQQSPLGDPPKDSSEALPQITTMSDDPIVTAAVRTLSASRVADRQARVKALAAKFNLAEDSPALKRLTDLAGSEPTILMSDDAPDLDESGQLQFETDGFDTAVAVLEEANPGTNLTDPDPATHTLDAPTDLEYQDPADAALTPEEEEFLSGTEAIMQGRI